MNASNGEDSLGRLTTRPASTLRAYSGLFRRVQLSAVLVAGVTALAVASGARNLGAVEATTSVASTEQQQQAPSSLAQAIRVAEKQTGGRARKVEMERERGLEVYEIKTVSRDSSSTVFVDLSSGNVVGEDTPGFFSSVGNIFEREDQREDQAAFTQLEATSMRLADAVDAAEKETGGRAVEASMRRQFGSTLFEVRIVRDLTAQRVVVDPSTGRVVTVPRTDDRDRD